MAKFVHPSTVLRIKTTVSLYLPAMDSINMKWMTCSILDSHSVQLRHVTEMSVLSKLTSESVTHQLSHS